MNTVQEHDRKGNVCWQKEGFGAGDGLSVECWGRGGGRGEVVAEMCWRWRKGRRRRGGNYTTAPANNYKANSRNNLTPPPASATSTSSWRALSLSLVFRDTDRLLCAVSLYCAFYYAWCFFRLSATTRRDDNIVCIYLLFSTTPAHV
jgi:hypothetical protein